MMLRPEDKQELMKFIESTRNPVSSIFMPKLKNILTSCEIKSKGSSMKSTVVIKSKARSNSFLKLK